MEKKKALIIGASRGLGFALAREFLIRNWSVLGTARKSAGTPLHDLLKGAADFRVRALDINDTEQLTSFRTQLGGECFDLLFVNAGISNPRSETISEVRTEDFVNVMVTNALSPMRIVEALQSNVLENGTIGIMSSGQGSIADNEKGGGEVYRASKAALNMLMRSFAARHAEDHRSLLLIAPGWIRTELGGPEARYSIEEAIPRVVNTIVAQSGKQGLQYLDQFGKTVRW